MILWDVNGMLMYDILQKLVLWYRSGPPYFEPTLHSNAPIVTTPLWGKCEDETRTPKSGNLEFSRTLATSELDCKGQNTLPRCYLYRWKGLEV